MTRSFGFSPRRLIKTAVAVPLLAGGLLALTATAASAHDAQLTASAKCSGVVTFTATSWSTGAKGTNPKIGIYFAVGNGAFKPVAPDTGNTIISSNGVTYAFNSSDNYKFTDSFTIPNLTTATKVTIEAKPLANWGDGLAPSNQATFSLTVPALCVQQTTTTTSTTVPKTTTTTSTTVPKTTTTTVPVTTSTTIPLTTTSTTVPDTTTTTVVDDTTTTTVLDDTTTTTVEVDATTIVNPTTTVPTEVLGEQISKGQLAFTGLNTQLLVTLGGGLVVIGAALIGFARRTRNNK